MRLYIAEKPSMGAEIAKCLTGPVQRKDGYLITKDGIVTWAFGHICVKLSQKNTMLNIKLES